MDEDRIDTYMIPPNFAEEGTMFSGRVKTRNAIETALILMILVPALLMLKIPSRAKMYVAIIVIVPVVILSVIGVQGESLFSFIGSFFRFALRRRYLAVPDERYRLERNRRRLRYERGGKKKRETGKRGRKQDMEEETKGCQTGAKGRADRRRQQKEEL